MGVVDASRADRGVLVLASVLVAAAWVGARLSAVPAWALLLEDIHWTLAAAAAAWFAYRGFRCEKNSKTVLRRTRAFFALGMSAVFVGQLAYDAQDYFGWQPFPSPSDVLYALQGPFYLIGFVVMLRRSLAAEQRGVVILDLAAFALAVLAFTLAIYLPLGADSKPSQLTALVIFPLVLLTVAVTAFVTHLHLRYAWSASWQILFLALCLRGLLRMSWDLDLLHAHEFAGSLFNGAFSLVFLMQGWGSLVWRPERIVSRKFDTSCEAVLRQVPLLTTALTVAAIGLVAFEHRVGDATRAVLVALSLAAAIIAVIRQTHQLSERDRLIETEQALAESRTRLEHVAHERLESIGRLAAGVAHEINTPVQYVSDCVHFVRDGVEQLLHHLEQLRTAPASNPLPEDLQYFQQQVPTAIASITEGLGRIAEIVSSMREFSYPDQAEMGPVDLNRAVQTTLVIARNEYKLVAEAKMELGELPPVICFGGHINQVILNLVVNAAHAIAAVVKGTDKRGVITVRTFLERDRAVISVSDTGGGIPEAIRHRIFEPFFTTKEVGSGTGQGLSMARNIVVKGHSGSLSFDTRSGEGTTFYERLPVTGSRNTESQPRPASTLPDESSTKKPQLSTMEAALSAKVS